MLDFLNPQILGLEPFNSRILGSQDQIVICEFTHVNNCYFDHDINFD